MSDLVFGAVVLYGTKFCPFCVAARHFFKARGIKFKDIPVDGDRELRREIARRGGQHTVPQVWIGERHVGGFTDLQALNRSGELDALLAAVYK